MKTVLLKNAEKNLKKIISTTISNNEETIIVTDEGSVVLIEEKEWEHVKETMRLLNDRRSLKALIESHNTRDSGLEPDGRSPEDIFTDA